MASADETTAFNSAVLGFRDLGFDEFWHSWMEPSDPIVRRHRCQVFALFPMVAAPVIIYPEIPAHAEIQSLIDQGRPLIAELARIAGVRSESVQFLREKLPPNPFITWIVNVVETLRAIDMVPVEGRPRTKEEWAVFTWLWSGSVAGYDGLRYRDLSHPARVHDLFEHLFIGLCADGLSACTRRFGPEFRRFGETKDYFRFVGKWCESGAGFGTLDAHGKTIAKRVVRDELLMRYSATELIRQSVRWRRLMARLNPAKYGFDGVMDLHHWPGLPGLPLSVGNLTVVALDGSGALRRERNGLCESLETHVRWCQYGDSHVVSIRNQQDESISTAELALMPDDRGRVTPKVVGHCSCENKEPTGDCEAALMSTLNMLRSDAMQDRLRELQVLHDMRRADLEVLLEQRHDPRSITMMCDVMRKVLPDYEEAIEWLGMRIAGEAMN